MTREMTWRYARRGRGGAKFWRLAAAKGNDDDEDLRSRGTGGVCNDNKQDDNYTMHRNIFHYTDETSCYAINHNNLVK